MKFLPPEEEIRAQLRELTSQTRRLRADLQGMITRRGHSEKAFSHDQRYRLKPERSAAAPEEEPAEAQPKPRPSPTPKSAPKSGPRKRR
jgi:hypothetical protein